MSDGEIIKVSDVAAGPAGNVTRWEVAPQHVDWSNRQARQVEILRLGLSYLPTEDGLPSDYRSWRARDKLCYTLLLTMVKEPDELASAFGLVRCDTVHLGMTDGELESLKMTAKYVNAAFRGLRQAHRFPKWREYVVDRWRALNTQARKKILRRAWPDIATDHRMDIYDAPLIEAHGQFRITRTPAATYTPQINLEDLSQSDNMLKFVSERAQYLPVDFVHGDLERARIERLGKGIPFPHLYLGSVNLEGYKENGEENDHYGKVERVQDTPDDLQRWFSSNEVLGMTLSVNDGALVLEIQARIIRGINRWMEALRAKFPTTVPTPKPDVDDRVFNMLDMHSILAIHIHYMGNMEPMQKILDMSKRKLKDARQRLYKLRNDPEYFVNWALEYFAHAPERALDSNGRHHPDLDAGVNLNLYLDIYDRTTATVIADAYHRCIAWEMLGDIINETLATSYFDPAVWKTWKREDHEVFVVSLLKLRKFLSLFMMRRVAGKITHVAATIPELREHYVRRTGSRTDISIKPEAAVDAMDNEVYLLSILATYWANDADPRYRLEFPPLVTLDDALVELNRQSDLGRILGKSKLLGTEIKEGGLIGLIVNHLRLTSDFSLVFSSQEGTDGALLELLPESKEEIDDWLRQVKVLLNELDAVTRCIDTRRFRCRPRLAEYARECEESLRAGDKTKAVEKLGDMWMAFDLHAETKGGDTVKDVMLRTLRKATEEAQVPTFVTSAE